MVHAPQRQRDWDKSLHTKQHSSGYVPKGRFDESPKTIDVSACSHELETTSKASQAESASTPRECRLGDERHVTHKICAMITHRRNKINPKTVRAHLKYCNHWVMSTTAFALSSDLSITSSRQPTNCLTRFATIISYSFIAIDEKARFHGLR